MVEIVVANNNSSARALPSTSRPFGIGKQSPVPIRKWAERLTDYLQQEDNKRLVHQYVVDPILNHVLDRVFPYIILTCALFSILVILVGMTFVLVLFRNASPKAAEAVLLALSDGVAPF